MSPTKRGPAGMECATGPERQDFRPTDSTSTAGAVNGQHEFIPEKRVSPLDLAKVILPDIFALAQALKWPLEFPGANLAWYRGNKNTPSLNVRDDGQTWYDFNLGIGGGAIDLLAVVEDLDRKAACRRFVAVAAEIQNKMTHQQLVQLFDRIKNSSSQDEFETRAIEAEERRDEEAADSREWWLQMAPLTTLNAADIARLIKSRHWPAAAAKGLQHASDLGFLFRRESFGRRGFVVTDRSRLSAKERRLDGLEIQPGRKTKAMPGSVSRWPLGAASIVRGDHVVLVEGETDQLALIALIAIFSPESLARITVVSLSAGSLVHDLALHRIQQRGNTVTVIADADDAGRRAIERWSQQFAESSVPCTTASVEGIVDGANDISDLLSELNKFPELGARLGTWVQTIVSTGAKDQETP